MIEPQNDVERAFRDAHLGLPETIAYFKELREAVLMFLVPYNPDCHGVMQIGNGSNFIFNLWKINGQELIPVFTSTARVQEALESVGKWHEENGLGEMLGSELLHVVSLQPGNWQIIINPNSRNGSRTMDAAMIASIVDGSALHLNTPGETALAGLVMSLPARQPERLLKPLTQFFKGCPEVKAAWLFYQEETVKPFERNYVLGIMVVGGDAEEMKREASLAIEGACPPEWSSRAWLMDPEDTGLTQIMGDLPPFYAAHDFIKPVVKPAPPEGN